MEELADDNISHDASVASSLVTPLSIPKFSASVELTAKPPLVEKKHEKKQARVGFTGIDDLSNFETHTAYSVSQLSFLKSESKEPDAEKVSRAPGHNPVAVATVNPLGICDSLMASGRYSEVLSYLERRIFEEIVELNPSFFMDAIECCFAISTTDAIQRAVSIGKEFVRLFPREEISHVCLAKSYMTQKDWENAILATTYGLSHFRNSQVLHNLRGHANYGASNFKMAVGDFHKGSEISRIKLGLAASMTSQALKTWKTTARK